MWEGGEESGAIPPLPEAPKFELARAPKVDSKELARRLAGSGRLSGLGCLVDGVNPHPLNMPGPIEAWMAGSLLMGADLGKGLEAAFGKRDGQVEGKYRKASVFAFETPSLLLFAVAERGDRGSEWSAAPKPAAASIGRLEALAEASSALRQVLVRLDEADAPSREELSRNAPGFMAELRARALAEKEEAELWSAAKPGAGRRPKAGP